MKKNKIIKTPKERIRFKKASKKEWKTEPYYDFFIDGSHCGTMFFYDGEEEPVIALDKYGSIFNHDFELSLEQLEDLNLFLPIIIKKVKDFKKEVFAEIEEDAKNKKSK